jgi:hypothetical protein
MCEEQKIFKTLVLFATDYTTIQIRKAFTVDWTEAAEKGPALFDLMHLAETPEKKKEINALLPRAVHDMGQCVKLMEFFMRFNTEARGPYLINSDHYPTDEELIAWAEVNVYKTDKPAKPFREI